MASYHLCQLFNGFTLGCTVLKLCRARFVQRVDLQAVRPVYIEPFERRFALGINKLLFVCLIIHMEELFFATLSGEWLVWSRDVAWKRHMQSSI